MQNGNATSSQQDTVAVVNGEEIKRQELAQECLTRFGNDVLEAVINKNLILTYCEKRGIKISNQDVDEEIARMAKQFSIPVDQWMQMLKQRRGIKPEQYADDIIRPTLARAEISLGEDSADPARNGRGLRSRIRHGGEGQADRPRFGR